jgi:two-component system chemotaxis response regulator CheB
LTKSTPIKVLIVDDSPFVRKALKRVFESDPETLVIGTASDGKEAIEKALTLNPDVITLDIMMPVMDGIKTLEVLMEIKPLPVLMLSQFTQEGGELTLKALELGAMDFIDKSTTGLMDFLSLANEILLKTKVIAKGKPRTYSKKQITHSEYTPHGNIDVVAIGASTGGPPALQSILQRFPENIDFAILIVQHMPKGFTSPLANRLNSLCRFPVKEASEGDPIDKGTALIAPSGLHMRVSSDGKRIRLTEDPLTEIHRPSVNVLFTSVAENIGARSVGVVLTGMGSDGAKGIMAIKSAGGLTIAQDEATSTIFGMPRAAIETKCVDKVLPITEISKEILNLSL